jgi:hypothetical protein
MQRHEVDVFSLVFGSMFLVFGALFLLTDASVANLEFAWVWPLLVIVAGLLMLAGAMTRRGAPPVEEEADHPGDEASPEGDDIETGDGPQGPDDARS